MDTVAERLKAHGMDERTLDWFYVRTTDVFTEYAPLSEPEPKRRARYEKIATLAEKLADEIGRDEWLRASITVEDYEIRRQALEQSGSLEEVEGRGLSISPNAGLGGENFTTLTLHSYLRGLAAYLRQDAITPSLQSLYEGYSPSGRALRSKAFAIKWCYGLLEDLESSGGIRKINRELAPNDLVATMVTVLLDLDAPLTASDVSHVRRNERRRYYPREG